MNEPKGFIKGVPFIDTPPNDGKAVAKKYVPDRQEWLELNRQLSEARFEARMAITLAGVSLVVAIATSLFAFH